MRLKRKRADKMAWAECSHVSEIRASEIDYDALAVPIECMEQTLH